MIIRDLTYKGVSLSDSLAGTTKIVVQSVNKDVKLRTAIFDKVNYHGATSSFTLASGRLFTIKGIIYGSTRSDRAVGQTVLNGIVSPESNPTTTNRGFYDLEWVDDSGNTMVSSAKVYSMPIYEHTSGSDIIDFSFELYSEESYYTATTDDVTSGGYGTIGGAALPFALPIGLDGKIGMISVNNEGNFAASCKIEIIGTIVNPKILNLTTGDFYSVSATTANFVFDTTGSKAIITNNGSDVSAYRVSGSRYISIVPGINQIIFLGSNYSADSTVTASITFRDTYISS